MNLDRADGHEEAACDLLVGQSVRRQLDDTPLRGRQLARLLDAAPADAFELRTRLLRPSGRPELVELIRSLLERTTGCTPLLQPTLRPPEAEQRPRPIEPKTERAVRRGRIRQRRRSGRFMTLRKLQQCLATFHTHETPRVLLLLRQLTQANELHQRLHQVGGSRKDSGLVNPLAAGVLPHFTQTLHRPRRLTREQRRDPARPQHLQDVPLEARAPCASDGFRRPALRLVGEAPTGGDQRTAAVVARPDRQVVLVGRLVEQPRAIVPRADAQLELTEVQAQKRVRHGLAALVREREQSYQRRARPADVPPPGEPLSASAIRREGEVRGGLRDVAETLAEIIDRASTEAAGPGEGIQGAALDLRPCTSPISSASSARASAAGI